MAKYNFHELEKNRYGRMNERWAIIKAIILLEEKDKQAWKELDAKNIEVVLTINGVEIDFLEIVSTILVQVNEMVREEAKKTLKKRLRDSYDILSEIEEYLQDKLSGLTGG